MAKDEEIKLSVDETNELRKSLGLAPLRTSNAVAVSSSVPTPKSNGNDEVLELSVDETNDLRAQLGLAPLTTSLQQGADGSSSRLAVHQPAPNTGQERELQERLEKARLEREVQQGVQKLTKVRDDQSDTPQDAQSWAERMRHEKMATSAIKTKSKKQKGRGTEVSEYSETDLEGLAVSHSVSELQAGSTTVLTLQDSQLLATTTDTTGMTTTLDEDGQAALENLDLISQQRQKIRLHQKRQVELGMGRAGGYAGFDDDEFAELGGTQGPSRMARRDELASPQDTDQRSKKRIGFQIGQAIEEQEADGNDLFAAHEGRAISLEPTRANVTASDFMTAEEYEAEAGPLKRKKKQKESKFRKKRKKDKKNRRKEIVDEDEGGEPSDVALSSKGLLEELEETAVEVKERNRKRRRSDSQDFDGEKKEVPAGNGASNADQDEGEKKRAKFDAIMAKGNERTAAAFRSADTAHIIEDAEPDDAFLNAALAKARRLKRLKEMSQRQVRGADAVAQSLEESTPMNGGDNMDDGSALEKVSTLSFSTDDTREFTRALRARAEQAKRQQARKTASNENGEEPQPKRVAKSVEPILETVDENMEELAKEMVDGEQDGAAADFEGTTANEATVGRGMSSVLSMLRRTGEITGKNAGREELRGRAKDKRTYEDYEALDLKNVVRIDERNANDKDKEFANREINLEYRDEHGRLLTRKEAYRNLCYQFHGHGSSKKNEERRLRQVEREQAAARLASRQVNEEGRSAGGSLGALKATQKATGKAFVVHKTS